MRRLFLAAGPERPFILTLYHTLARVDEILRLKWQDVNFQERTIRLWTRKRKDGAWTQDILPLNQILHENLRALRAKADPGEYVFTNPKTGTRFMHRPKLMRGLCRRAGIRHFGFHAIRHYVASLLHERYLQVVDQGR